jgi:hypothetical protein
MKNRTLLLLMAFLYLTQISCKQRQFGYLSKVRVKQENEGFSNKTKIKTIGMTTNPIKSNLIASSITNSLNRLKSLYLFIYSPLI